jgi:alkylhydroperoxidase domain protein
MSDTTSPPLAEHRPVAFTQANIGWRPWLEPLREDQLTPRHWDGLTEASRAKSAYFMLLARDPEILGARTRTDKDIFYNPEAGLPRGERELAATAVSRFNGCIFCASVHARFASTHSKRGADLDTLLLEGIGAEFDPRWTALIDASVTLTATPSSFGPEDIAELRGQGLDDLAIADLIHAAAFFNWANRLMLSLGEPTPAA